MSNMNPLAQYTKTPIKFTKLVTNSKVPYSKSVIEDTSTEIGICARSARDELLFNNPDALMNGKAVSTVIENCVKEVKNADELFVPDVELLLIGIKLATKEETYEIIEKCPKCEKEGMFERDLNYLFEQATLMQEEPVLALDNGLVIYFKPHTWKEHTEFSIRTFQQQKTMQFADKIEEDDEKLKFFSTFFDNMAQLQFDILTTYISRIELPDNVVVDNKEHIKDWANNLDKNTVEVITEAAYKMNSFGVDHNLDVECSECKHQWTIEGLQFDPSSFFVDSFSRKTTKK